LWVNSVVVALILKTDLKCLF